MFNKNNLLINILLIACIVFVSISAVSATDSTNVSNFTELNDAISNGNNATLINDINGLDGIKEGIIVNQDVTVDGNGYTINAEFNSRIFNVINCTFTLKNITLKNGYVNGFGGAIYAESSIINLDNVIFNNNIALIGGSVCTNNTDINIINNVIFNNNTAFVGAAVTILSRNVFDTKYVTFINNHAYYGINVFSKGDIIIYFDSKLINYDQILKYYLNNYNNSYNHKYDNIFNNYSVTVIDANGLMNTFKSLSINSFKFDAKEALDSLSLGKIYYVNNFDELSYVFEYINFIYECIEKNPDYSMILNNNIAKSNFLTAKIILLEGNYNANKRINIGYSGKKVYDMNITINGNGQVINCNNFNQNYLFYFINGNLFLNNLTIANANNNINKGLRTLIYSFNSPSGLFLNNCNFINNTINTIPDSYKEQIISEIVLENLTPVIKYKEIEKTSLKSGSLIKVSEIYINDNVNFINNINTNMINADIFIINGNNNSFINNSFEEKLIITRFSIINGMHINFINNTGNNDNVKNHLNKYTIITNRFNYLSSPKFYIFTSNYLIINSNDFNYINNNATHHILTTNYGYITGNLSFINNEGTIFTKNLNVENNIIYKFEELLEYPNSLGEKIFTSLYNHYALNNTDYNLYVVGKDINFINNHGDIGTIFKISEGNIYLENLTLTNNTANYGGAIFIGIDKSTTIKTTCNDNIVNIKTNNLIFKNNNASYGGAIYIDHSNVNIISENIHFDNNFAKYGGAIYAEYSNINITTEYIVSKNNKATYGGVYYLKNTNMNITGDNIISVNNIATIYGSAIYLIDSELNFKGEPFFDNNLAYYNIDHPLNNGEGWNIPYFINKNSLLSINNNTSTNEQFIIGYNDIVEYCSDTINFVNNGTIYTGILNEMVLNQCLKQFDLNNINELNESNCDINYFAETLINNTKKLFDKDNYNSYTVAQLYVLMDGTYYTHYTKFVNIHNFKEYNSLHFNNGITSLYLNFDEGIYVFPKDYINDIVKNYESVIDLHINGNGAEFINEKFGDTSMFGDCEREECQFMKIDKINHVYINNVTFSGFNNPFINNGYLFLTNCTFNKNRVVWLIKKDYGAIINNGLLQCVNCSFIDNKAKYGSIYNSPGTYCAVVNCSFKGSCSYDLNNGIDIHNYNDGLSVNCTIQNTDCTIYNEAGMPKWMKIFYTVLVTSSLAIITGAIIGKVGYALGGIVAANLIGVASYSTIIAAGAGAGFVAGVLLGGAFGFIAGSIEAAVIGGIYRQSVDEILLDYAIRGAIMGAIGGGISGALGGAIGAYKKMAEIVKKMLDAQLKAQQTLEEAAKQELKAAGKDLPNQFELDPTNKNFIDPDNAKLYTAKYFPDNDPNRITYSIGQNYKVIHESFPTKWSTSKTITEKLFEFNMETFEKIVSSPGNNFIELVSQNLFGKIVEGTGTFGFSAGFNINTYVIKFSNGFVFRLLLGF